MAFSLESRLPFLDYRIVEWGFGLLRVQKISRGLSKVVLRKVAKQYIPKSILENRKKVGFVTPQQKWQRTDLKPYLDDLFAGDIEAEIPLLDGKEVRLLYKKYREGENDDWESVWRLANLVEWRRSFLARDWKGGYAKT